jgi:DNA invertase Pin-like site-specific DNA recombinase
MRAAVYARYSSENQRPESIEDQIGACRRLARERGFAVLEDHIYSDQAQSGARRDRLELSALIAAANNGQFEIVLVDDLSRLARDNYLMPSVIAELHFEGVRVISVADGLDSDDEEATLGIQIRGIFNELQLRDLKKKTLRKPGTGQGPRRDRAAGRGVAGGARRAPPQPDEGVPAPAHRVDRGAPQPRPGSPGATHRAVCPCSPASSWGPSASSRRRATSGGRIYMARTSLDCLALLLEPPPGAAAPDGGSNSLRQWRRRE